MNRTAIFALATALLLLSGCYSPRVVQRLELPAREGPTAERDSVYSLLAFSIVYKDWQVPERNPRGHNIGAVLVNSDGEVVGWARNCNFVTQNGTQHAEVRLIQNYLNRYRTYDLKNFTVYTTLEPCAQCAGMMTLVNVRRCVYGQSDPAFGKAFERLQIDTSGTPGGMKPYPRKVDSEKCPLSICTSLEKAYSKRGGSITEFLLTDDAERLFSAANLQMREFRPFYRENSDLVERAINFLNSVAGD